MVTKGRIVISGLPAIAVLLCLINAGGPENSLKISVDKSGKIYLPLKTRNRLAGAKEPNRLEAGFVQLLTIRGIRNAIPCKKCKLL